MPAIASSGLTASLACPTSEGCPRTRKGRTSRGPIRPTETYELTENATGGTTVRCTIDVQPAGAARIAAPLLTLLHPLFAVGGVMAGQCS